MSFLTPVWSYVDVLVHPAAQHDALTAARHRVCIAPRLLGSFAALASFPVYLALRGVPSDIQSRLGEGTRVTVRLPLECEGGRSASDPVKLVTKRNRSFPMATNDRVKKSA